MGSEMCIRDRDFGPSLILRRLVDIDDVANAAADKDADGQQPRPCLLYTSDAADERSSVDLGGRRIIKKTNYDTMRHDARTSKTRDDIYRLHKSKT